MNNHPDSHQRSVQRILDANLNRASEGMRVVEEYARFVLEDPFLTSQWKSLRHDVFATADSLAGPTRLSARDASGDVGTRITAADEYQRADLPQIAAASQSRVEQSLRCLEEYGKLLDGELGRDFERFRYRAYILGRAMFATSAALARLAGVSLCVLVDGRESSDALATLTDELVSAGTRFIQLRDKQLDDRALVERARAVRAATQNKETLFVVNDRPDIARMVNADGVHLGQQDVTVADARAVVGDKLVGVSTHNIEQARQAVLDGADYLGCGPTFPSKTKHFTSFPGLAFLEEVAREIRLPAFAIGGITRDRLDDVRGAGFGKVAVSSAVTQSQHPGVAAAEFLRALDRDKVGG